MTGKPDTDPIEQFWQDQLRRLWTMLMQMNIVMFSGQCAIELNLDTVDDFKLRLPNICLTHIVRQDGTHEYSEGGLICVTPSEKADGFEISQIELTVTELNNDDGEPPTYARMVFKRPGKVKADDPNTVHDQLRYFANLMKSDLEMVSLLTADIG